MLGGHLHRGVIILTRTFLVGIRCLSVSDLMYCTISTSSCGWRTSWSFALSSRDAHTQRWRRVKVERQQPCFLARDWYESVSSGPKVSSSARASSSGIVVLSYGGVQSRRQCWWGVHYAPVCITRPCTLPCPCAQCADSRNAPNRYNGYLQS